MAFVIKTTLRKREQLSGVIRTIVLRVLIETTLSAAVFYIQLWSPYITIIIVPAITAFTIYEGEETAPAHAILILCFGNTQKPSLELRGSIVCYFYAFSAGA